MHPIVKEIPLREILLLTFGGPFVVLPVLSLTSGLTPLVFGDLIFGLTIVTCFGWVVLNLNEENPKRSPEARSILSRRSRRFRAIKSASPDQLRSMAKWLFFLTGAVVFGWGYLLTT